MKKTKLEKGITLVALIITIVVLLILAVVSIGAVRNSGIIGHATNTSDAWKKAQKEENTYLQEYESYVASSGATAGVPIPAGFEYVEGTKTTGLVITDGNSEFVWIPVDNIEEFAKPTSGTDANGRTNYRGVLYNWSTDSTGNTEYTWSSSSTSYREPANLSTTYDGTSKMSIWTETLYQASFNKMVESVAKYGGFYVGRYETSMNGNVAQSKSGETSMYNVTWYEAYTNSQTYSASGVVAEMIWGCQWDAMVKFLGSDIKSTGGNTSRVTGSEPNDKIKNLYDLIGNSYEWTQEAFDTFSRVARGGYYYGSSSPSYRYPGYPAYGISNYASRLTLYVEL